MPEKIKRQQVLHSLPTPPEGRPRLSVIKANPKALIWGKITITEAFNVRPWELKLLNPSVLEVFKNPFRRAEIKKAADIFSYNLCIL